MGVYTKFRQVFIVSFAVLHPVDLTYLNDALQIQGRATIHTVSLLNMMLD